MWAQEIAAAMPVGDLSNPLEVVRMCTSPAPAGGISPRPVSIPVT